MLRYILISFIIFMISGCDKKEDNDLKFYGNVDVRTVSLAFQVPGKIKSINFEEGQKVKKGDVIATLDDSLYKEYLKQIEAQVEVQKAQVAKLEKGYRQEEIDKAKATMEQKKVLMENAKTTLKRYKKLLSTNSTSQESYDNALTAYESADALYMFAKSSFELLNNGYQER